VITMIVTYAGDETTPFNRDHWIDVHFPIVRECWEPYGLISAAGFFPPADGAGVIAIATVNFRDEAAMHAALNAPETERVMADVSLVTAVQPQRRIAMPLST
jgi:uncharacterized protein (TIGR02118 family)